MFEDTAPEAWRRGRTEHAEQRMAICGVAPPFCRVAGFVLHRVHAPARALLRITAWRPVCYTLRRAVELNDYSVSFVLTTVANVTLQYPYTSLFFPHVTLRSVDGHKAQIMRQPHVDVTRQFYAARIARFCNVDTDIPIEVDLSRENSLTAVLHNGGCWGAATALHGV